MGNSFKEHKAVSDAYSAALLREETRARKMAAQSALIAKKPAA